MQAHETNQINCRNNRRIHSDETYHHRCKSNGVSQARNSCQQQQPQQLGHSVSLSTITKPAATSSLPNSIVVQPDARNVQVHRFSSSTSLQQPQNSLVPSMPTMESTVPWNLMADYQQRCCQCVHCGFTYMPNNIASISQPNELSLLPIG